MKKTAWVILCACMLSAMFTGCAPAASTEPLAAEEDAAAFGTAEKSGNDETGEKMIGFRAKYVRTDGYRDGEKYPKTVWITSARELEEYCEDNRERYYLESRKDPTSGRSIGFMDEIQRYDDDFFEAFDLLFVILEEGSGSVRHEVTGVRVLPSQNGKHILRPEIDRLVPEVGTEDMAEWHIMIEVEKKYGQAASEKVDPVIEEKRADGLPEPACRSETGGHAAEVTGPYGRLSILIPDTWTAEPAPMDSGKLMDGLYGLILKPTDAPADHLELYCTDSFGVCGTGLSEETRDLAGCAAVIGTFDDHAHWDFVAFPKDGAQIVARHTGGSSWTAAIWNETMAILDSVQFDTGVAEGGASQFIRESEADEIAVVMEVSRVTESGLTVTFRQYDERDAGELIVGEGFVLSRLEGEEWTEVPPVIEKGAFNDIGYPIPTQGKVELETNWEWLYGKLVPGTYRITKTVWETTGEGASRAYPLTAQFILAG